MGQNTQPRQTLGPHHHPQHWKPTREGKLAQVLSTNNDIRCQGSLCAQRPLHTCVPAPSWWESLFANSHSHRSSLLARLRFQGIKEFVNDTTICMNLDKKRSPSAACVVTFNKDAVEQCINNWRQPGWSIEQGAQDTYGHGAVLVTSCGCKPRQRSSHLRPENTSSPGASSPVPRH